MNEPNKPRFMVDLDEIDRQLTRNVKAPAQHQDVNVSDYAPMQVPPAPVFPAMEPVPQQPQVRPVPAGPGPQGGDPLYELSRIVGQEDPFQSLLGGGATPPPSPYAPAVGGVAYVPATPRREEPVLGHSPEVGNLSEQLRSGGVTRQPVYPATPRQEAPSFDDFDALANMARQGPATAPAASYYPQATVAPTQPNANYSPSAGAYEDYAPSYADPKLGYQADYDSPPEDHFAPQRPTRRKWGLIGGVTVAALIIGGIVYAARQTGVIGSSEPPLVTASTEPTKIAPETPGGKEFPDQNKQIYQSNAKEGSTQVVNREEQPVDIREATGARGMQDSNNSFGEARKVRTVVVRPDGASVATSDPSAAASEAPAVSTASSQPNPVTVRSVPNAPAATTQPPAQAAQPARPPQAQPAATPPQRPQQVASTSRSQEAAPSQAPTARPSQQPSAAAAAPAATSGGGYVVQFGVSGSEAEGKTRFNRLKSQYPSVFGNISPTIRAAEVNGRTVYRIRTGGMSKEAGDTLCSNLKAAGGDCFVVRN